VVVVVWWWWIFRGEEKGKETEREQGVE